MDTTILLIGEAKVYKMKMILKELGKIWLQKQNK